MPEYQIVKRVVSFPVYQIEADTLEEALEKLDAGDVEAVKEDVNEDDIVRCERLEGDKSVALTDEEKELMRQHGDADAVMDGD